MSSLPLSQWPRSTLTFHKLEVIDSERTNFWTHRKALDVVKLSVPFWDMVSAMGGISVPAKPRQSLKEVGQFDCGMNDIITSKT